MKTRGGFASVIFLAALLFMLLPLSSAISSQDLEITKTISPSVFSQGENITITFLFNETGVSIIQEPRKNLDVMLVLDVSPSMQGSKLVSAIEASKVLIDNLNSTVDKIGLVKFSSTSSLLSPPISDFNVIRDHLDSLNIGSGTNIAAGITAANQQLTDTSTIKIEVLLSDGRSTIGNVIAAADESKNKNISIYAITLGDDANQATMAKIANATDGKYYYAPNEDQLSNIFLDIAGEMNNRAETNAISNLILIDTLPSGVQLSHLPPGAVYNASSRAVAYSLSSLSPGEINSFSFDIAVNSDNLTYLNERTQVSYIDSSGFSRDKYICENLGRVNGAGIAGGCVYAPDESTKLPFFGFFNFVVASLMIAMVYFFFLRNQALKCKLNQ